MYTVLNPLVYNKYLFVFVHFIDHNCIHDLLMSIVYIILGCKSFRIR